jgi:hypothetical protein
LGYTTGSAFTSNSGVWTGTALDGTVFTFTNATGLFNVSSIPEPSTFAAFMGLAGLGCAFMRRRRNS